MNNSSDENSKKGRGTPGERGPARAKLDPRLALIAALSEDRLDEARQTDEQGIEAGLRELEDLRRQRLEATGGVGDDADALTAEPAYGDRGVIGNLSIRARAELLQMATLLHGIDMADKKSPRASVFIKFRGDIARIERLGVTVRSVAGDIATATIPLSSLAALEADDEIIFIELSRPAFPDLDDSVPLIGADLLHGGAPGVDGAGTIVGFVDYGLDFYHPDFRDPTTTTTRVRRLWHQDPGGAAGTAGAAPAPWGYGLEYTQADIDSDLTSGSPYSVVDHRAGRSSHGTHVAGIAAGNGTGDGLHIGVAPGADIIFVDTIGSGTLAVADLTQISDGLDYIFTRAGAVPCVVNMSLGDNLGPHDGTSLVEQFIDNILDTPGRAVTLTAGNANQNDKHATGIVPNGGTLNEQIQVAATTPTNRAESMEIWYDGHDRFDITLTDPGGTVIGPVTPGATLTVAAGTTTVTITSIVNDPRNDDNLISVIFQPAAGTRINTGNWSLQLSGSSGGSPSVINGRWHGWIDRNTRHLAGGVANPGVSWAAPTAGNLTLGTPGTCRRAITVASHAKTGAEALAGSSGRGPTRDNRVKPEIAAPGVGIWAARSRDMTDLVPGALYTQKSGTSMAAPHVAGSVALLFQCRGAGLSAADAKYIMQSLADTTAIASVPDLGFGWGRLRVGNSCAWVASGPDVWIKTNAADTGVEPYAGGQAWRSPDIWVRPNRDGGLVHENPEHGQENHVHVIVRNRGTGVARNTQVYLYWADPATNIPFGMWQTEGIRVGLEESNVQVIPELAAGVDMQVPLPFSWFPPAPGSNIRGDDHFCLLARIENESDPSNVGPGGWSSVREHNNIALKNVHIVDLLPDTTDADVIFYVYAEAAQTSLLIDARDIPRGTKATLQLPVQALDLRPYTEVRNVIRPEPLLDMNQAVSPRARMKMATVIGNELSAAKIRIDGGKLQQLGGVYGANHLEFTGPMAMVSLRQPLVYLSRLSVQTRERIPVRVRINGIRGRVGDTFEVNVEQWADGNPVGGMTTIFRIVEKKWKVKPKQFTSVHRLPEEVLMRWSPPAVK